MQLLSNQSNKPFELCGTTLPSNSFHVRDMFSIPENMKSKTKKSQNHSFNTRRVEAYFRECITLAD